MENDEGVQSPVQREKVFRWLNRALLPAGSEHCNVLFVGTALHPEDSLQKIKTTPGWRTTTFSALIREPDRQDLWDQWRMPYRNLFIEPLRGPIERRRF